MQSRAVENPTQAGTDHCGPSGPVRSSVRSTEAQPVSRWREASEEDTREAAKAALALGFPSTSRLPQCFFSLFSRSAFQKPFHFNKVLLQMKQTVKASYGKVSKAPWLPELCGSTCWAPQAQLFCCFWFSMRLRYLLRS